MLIHGDFYLIDGMRSVKVRIGATQKAIGLLHGQRPRMIDIGPSTVLTIDPLEPGETANIALPMVVAVVDDGNVGVTLRLCEHAVGMVIDYVLMQAGPRNCAGRA